MQRPEPVIVGPTRATARDITALNNLFSNSFTERYRRDGLSGVRVPHLNPRIWQYALDLAGEGAMLWHDGRGEIAAFNFAHCSGTEGWMGPLAVRTDRQGRGLGSRIVSEGVQWLKARGATVIGLETMPRTIDNIGFYSQLGFRPGPLTISLAATPIAAAIAGVHRMGQQSADSWSGTLAALRRLTDRVAPGVDFTRECELTLQQRLGDVTVIGEGDAAARAFAVWHTEQLATGRQDRELRILKLVAMDLDAAMQVVAAAMDTAAEQRCDQVAIRCQGSQPGLYAALVEAGWRVRWTDLRMTLAGYHEQVPSGVMLSNWEI